MSNEVTKAVKAVDEVDEVETVRKSFAIETARNILEANNIHIAPVDLLKIANSLNVIVESFRLPGGIEGLSCKVSEDSYVVVINNTIRSNDRRIFTLAHELGHIALNHHHSIAPSFDATIFHTRNLCLYSNPRIEREANIFASEIIMPVNMIIQSYLAGIKSIKQLSRLFFVSEEAMKIKLKEIGLIKFFRI